MKKIISLCLALCVIFALTIPAGAAGIPSVEEPTHTTNAGEDELMVTVTTSVSYFDEDGNLVVLEEDSETLKNVPIEPDLSGDAMLQAISYLHDVQYFKGFENGTVGCYIDADFEYEPGKYVSCYQMKSGVYNIPSGWTKLSENSYKQQASNKSWATANYSTTMLTLGNQTRVYQITIRADYKGNISKY